MSAGTLSNKPINQKIIANDSSDIIAMHIEIQQQQVQPIMTLDCKNKLGKTPPGARDRMNA